MICKNLRGKGNFINSGHYSATNADAIGIADVPELIADVADVPKFMKLVKALRIIGYQIMQFIS